MEKDEEKKLNDRSKKEEDDGTGYERKVGMKGGKLSGGQK